MPIYAKSVGEFESIAVAPTAAEYGVGPAWIGGVLYWSDGRTFRIKSSSPTLDRSKTAGTLLVDFGVMWDSAGTAKTVGKYTARANKDTAGITGAYRMRNNSDGALRIGATAVDPTRWVMASVEKTDAAWDLSAATFLCLEVEQPINIPSTSGYEIGLKIALIGDSGTTLTNWYWCANWWSNNGMRKKGKWVYRFPMAAFTVAGGAPSLSSIRRIGVMVASATSYAMTGAPIELKVRRIYSDLKQKTKCVFSFDDGAESVYDVIKPIFDANGWVASIGVNGSRYAATRQNGYMSIPEIKTLHDAGWDIANHTYDHTALAERSTSPTISGNSVTVASDYAASRTIGDTISVLESADARIIGDWTITNKAGSNITFDVTNAPNSTYMGGATYFRIPGKTDQQVVDEFVNTNRDWCFKNGLTNGADLFIYPNGIAPHNLWPVLKSNGYRFARSTRTNFRYTAAASSWSGNVDIAGWHTLDGWFEPHDGPQMWMDGVGDSGLWDTASEFLALVDKCIDGGSIFPYGHTFTADGSSNYSPSEAALLFAGIKEMELDGKLEVLSLSAWCDQMGL